ncbi:MAG: hypothetical protein KCHDKBKB_02629 [Elusimicrobia bacterium]|nr:hypothetical protein [Elusimicrobiota bacterium]
MRKISLWAIVLFYGFSGTCFAYMDPGSGSLLLQLLAGGVAGLVVAFRIYWKKIKGVFKKSSDN